MMLAFESEWRMVCGKEFWRMEQNEETMCGLGFVIAAVT